MTTNATYTKLKSGEWAIRIIGTARKGEKITVSKKDGTTKTETIGNIVWTDGKVTLAAIAKSEYKTQNGRRGTSQDEYRQGLEDLGWA